MEIVEPGVLRMVYSFSLISVLNKQKIKIENTYHLKFTKNVPHRAPFGHLDSSQPGSCCAPGAHIGAVPGAQLHSLLCHSYGLNCEPQYSYVETLTHSASECDFLLEIGSLQI